MTRLFFGGVLLLFSLPISAQILSSASFQLVNSEYDERSPVLSPDGKTLYFTIANHPQNIGGKDDPGDIWISHLKGNKWTAPENGGPNLNNKVYNGVAGISSDGTQLFLFGHYDPSYKKAHTQGIAVSKNNGSGWSHPENFFLQFFLNKSDQLSGYVSPDSSILIFSGELFSTIGSDDLYVSFNKKGKWTEPINLGRKINTPFQELSPSLSSDGKTLYFSSNGRDDSGNFDIYTSQRLDITWRNWSPPVRINENINTEGREVFYRNYADLGYSLYTTTKINETQGDIRMSPEEVTLPIDSTLLAAPTDSAATDVIVKVDSAIENTLVKIYGEVINVKTSRRIDAQLSISGAEEIKQAVATSSDGFTILVKPTSNLSIQIESKGFISASEKLDLTKIKTKEYKVNFKLQPAEIGTTVNLKNVLFERGSANLLPESNPELDLVVSFLKSNPTVKIELSGHTDNRGVYSDNAKLSQDRVNKVKEYLVKNGIDSRRVTGKGYGGTRPIASNKDEETRKLNRRVEFTIKNL